MRCSDNAVYHGSRCLHRGMVLHLLLGCDLRSLLQGAILGHGVQGALGSVAADATDSALFVPQPAPFTEPAAGRLLGELLQRQHAHASRRGELSSIIGTIGNADEVGAAAMSAKLDTPKQPTALKADTGGAFVQRFS